MMHIGVIDTMNQKGINLLKNNHKFTFEIITNLSKENILAKIPTFDGITLRRGIIDEDIINNAQKLKVIARHGVGYDNVDLEALNKKGIKLLVTHNSTSTSPAEHAFFMIMNIYKGRDLFDKMVREGNFYKALHLKINDNFELYGKKILIVGFGRIGKKLIKKCLGFDMQVLVYDPYVDDSIVNSLGGIKVDNLSEGMKICDILSLSLPFNRDTKNLINFKNISLMKNSAIIINIARGGIVNEIELDRALNEKLISFAGIDVFEKEPPDKNNPLLRNPRVVLSPHAATFTKECLEQMSVETVQNVIDFFDKSIDPVKIINK
jgi:D-3-phosphoglycerate dehydrogenase